MLYNRITRLEPYITLKQHFRPLEAFHREYKEQANEWDGRNNNNNNNNNDSNDGDKLDMASTIKFNEIKVLNSQLHFKFSLLLSPFTLLTRQCFQQLMNRF